MRQGYATAICNKDIQKMQQRYAIQICIKDMQYKYALKHAIQISNNELGKPILKKEHCPETSALDNALYSTTEICNKDMQERYATEICNTDMQ